MVENYPQIYVGLHVCKIFCRPRITLDLGAKQLPRAVDRTKLCLYSDWPYIAAEQLVLRQPLHAHHLRFPVVFPGTGPVGAFSVVLGRVAFSGSCFCLGKLDWVDLSKAALALS